jgi:hypothetical protein
MMIMYEINNRGNGNIYTKRKSDSKFNFIALGSVAETTQGPNSSPRGKKLNKEEIHSRIYSRYVDAHIANSGPLFVGLISRYETILEHDR